ATMKLKVSHRGKHHEISFEENSSPILSDLQREIEKATSIPPHLQKLLPSKVAGSPSQPKLNGQRPEATLEELGIRDGMRIMLLGVTGDELKSVTRQELAAATRQSPRKLHESLLRGARPRNTTMAAISPFGNIYAHPNFPAYTPEANERAASYLRRLANDQGVLHVMALHSYHVGVLTELLPHEHPNLLGLNENMGQRISLRIRTDRYDGFRDYATSRRVLMHELAHIEVHDHPPEFKELNSLLNAQLAAFERAQRDGSHLLSVDEVYEPESGGRSSGRQVGMFGQTREEEEREERRLRILRATEERLSQMEHDIELGCGSTRKGGQQRD
ncbi:WLM-domain-containing protein, partial [Tilletiaria anomala UBC 951]